MRFMLMLSALAIAASGAANTRMMTRASETYLPDGSRGYHIDCSDLGAWGNCHERVGMLCKERGYEVVQ